MADGFASAGIFASYGMLAFGLYPSERHGAGEASLNQLADLAEKGNAPLIYPQGMHARPAQERAGDPSVRFRPGVAHLAAELGASVVPFGCAGTELLMPPLPGGVQGDRHRRYSGVAQAGTAGHRLRRTAED